MPSHSKVSLTSELGRLAARFADDVLAAFAKLRLDDVLTVFGRQPGGVRGVEDRSRRTRVSTARIRRAERRPARSQRRDSVDAMSSLLAVVSKSPNGLRAEELRRTTGLEKVVFARAVRAALATGELGKEGALRATRYFAISEPRDARSGPSGDHSEVARDLRDSSKPDGDGDDPPKAESR